MRITYLLPPIEHYSPQNGGAIATFAMQQGRRMVERGYEVSVISPHENEEIYKTGVFYPLNGVTRETLPSVKRAFSTRIRRRISNYDWLYYEYYLREAKRALKVASPDVVLCFNDWQLPREVALTLPKARVFLRLSNECRTNARDVETLVRTPEKIFCLSDYIRDWTAEHFPVPTEKYVSLPNGADLDSFSPMPDYETRIFDATRPLKALFISRLDPNKGPDLAIKSVALLRQKNIQVDLTLAGGSWFGEEGDKDPYVQELRSLAPTANANLCGYVARPQVPDLVREHDILLFPVRNNEPMSQVVFEAMASGLVVISCPLGGVPQACGDAALWAQPDDANSLAEKLLQLHENRDLLLEHKRRSIARAKIMTWDANADRFEAVLKQKPS